MIKDIAHAFLFLYAVVFGLALLAAVLTGHDHYYQPPHCDRPLTRIEYILPAYPLGCWLTETP